LSLSAAAPLVVEELAVSYLPSASLVGAGFERQAMVAPWRRQLVAFGDPVAPANGVFPDDRRWARLPNAARELDSIAAELPGRAEIHAGPGDLKALLTGGR